MDQLLRPTMVLTTRSSHEVMSLATTCSAATSERERERESSLTFHMYINALGMVLTSVTQI